MYQICAHTFVFKTVFVLLCEILESNLELQKFSFSSLFNAILIFFNAVSCFYLSYAVWASKRKCGEIEAIWWWSNANLNCLMRSCLRVKSCKMCLSWFSYLFDGWRPWDKSILKMRKAKRINPSVMRRNWASKFIKKSQEMLRIQKDWKKITSKSTLEICLAHQKTKKSKHPAFAYCMHLNNTLIVQLLSS